MQINSNLNTASNINISGRATVDMGLASLAEGDSITARVIFSGDGTAHLKTADGGLIRARLDGNITLPEGSQVTLTVEEKSADSVTLRIAGVGGQGSEANAAGRQQSLPPALTALFEQIQSSNLPAAQKVDLFVKALADFPTLNAQNPAVQQALSALTAQGGGQQPAQVGLGQMLVELAVLVSNLENTATGGQQTAPAIPSAPATPGVIIAEGAAPTTATPAAPEAPVNPTTGSAPAASVSPAAANAAATATAIAPEITVAAQPANANPAANTAAITPNADNPNAAALNTAAPTAHAAPAAVEPNASAQPNAPAFPAAASAGAPTQSTPAAATVNATPATQAAPAAPATAQPNAPAPPAEALQTVRQMIGELYPPGSSEPGPRALAQFIERLFAHVGRTMEQGGEQLQKCARELEVRLNLLKEAISQSSLPQREELLSQTNRILQQTETLREARLLCLQLPIQFEQQKQTAELYIYRRERRAGQKLDPQNATILLALNTEHLGRLEALIQTRGKEINLKLEISRAEAVPLVREYSQTLPRLLKEAGFRLNSSSVEHLRKERNNPQAAEHALIEYQRNFDGKLDFFI